MDRIYVIGRDNVPASIVLRGGESLSMCLVALPGAGGVVSLEIEFAEPGCSLDLSGVFVCAGGEKLRMEVTVRHSAPGCSSRQLFRGIAGGSASVRFDGLIYVAHGAQKTSASQAVHSILLSREALAEARPQLEIYADDVECSHGATSGFLNADEQFYMRSRGIPEDEAKHLQMIAFLAPVASRLPDGIKEEIYDNIP